MRILVCDTETTLVTMEDGLVINYPVEVAFLELDEELNIISSFETLANPGCPIDPEAMAVHHITDEMVAGRPSMEEILEAEFSADFFNDVLVVAHHAPFDSEVMNPYWEIADSLCTLRAARHLYPDAPAHKLQVLRYWLKLVPMTALCGDAHRAMADVAVLYELLWNLIEVGNFERIEDLLELSKSPITVTRMPFGKHKGMELKDLPSGYVRWLLGTADIDDDLRQSLLNI